MSSEVIEAAAEVVETGLRPTGELAVTYMPAKITDNLDAIAAWVSDQLRPYEGAVIDPDDARAVKVGRKCMADLNKIRKPIDDERKRIAREYKRPLAEFEARVKAITEQIDSAREGIKVQVDAADAAFQERRMAELREEYAAIAGPIADVIPYEALHDKSWLARSCKPAKASDELADRAAEALQGYEALQGMELRHAHEVLKAYCDTLDMTAALRVEGQLNEADERMAAFQAAQEAAAMAKAERSGPEPKPQADPAPWQEQPPVVQPAQPGEPVLRWSLEMEFDGTPTLARQVADALRGLGITGAVIKAQGKAEEEGR